MTIRHYLAALLAAERAHRAMKVAEGTDAHGKATETAYDANGTYSEQRELLRRKPASAEAVLAHLEAMARTKALLAAVEDMQRNGASDAAVEHAQEAHRAAKRAEARALWALREVVG